MYQHNKVVYEELKDRLKTDTRVCVVQATGTGKGVIARTLIEEYESVIVVAPTQAILKNYQINLKVKSDNLQYFTYQAISMMLNPQLDNLAKGVTLLILDEFHRIGAKTWGRKVEYLAEKIENFNGKVVGLSATPVRYLDNERDMSIEFFNGNVVSGLNLVEAVVNGVLPTFKYVVSYYGYEKDLFNKMEERKDKLTDNIKALVANLENNYSIGKIIRQEIKDLGNNQKWIVFFSSVEELESFKDTVPVWFDKKVNVYTLHSYSNYKENMNILNDFNNAEKGVNVLLSVNMLNEGVHLQGIDGVIMMRRTISPIVYLQQLGRALQVGGKEPIIFDFIGNYRRMGEYEDNAEIFNFVDEINKHFESNKKIRKEIKKIIVHSYKEEILEILEKISSLYLNRWTGEEISILKKYYPDYGGKYIYTNFLSNHPVSSIQEKAREIGLEYIRDKWKLEDIELLKENYPKYGGKYIKDNILPNYSLNSIMHKVKVLGLKMDEKWTKMEDDILRDNYSKYGAKRLSETLLSRYSCTAISARASILGLKVEEKWTEEEDLILKENYSKYGPKYLSETLLSRYTRSAIVGRAQKLGLKKEDNWSEDEENILRKYYSEYGPKYIAEHFLPNHTKSSIRGRADKLGIVVKKWTTSEIEILQGCHNKYSAKYISEHILKNYSKVAIQKKAHLLGINLIEDIYWTEDKKVILKNAYEIGGLNEVKSVFPDKSEQSLRTQINNLGLKEIKNYNFWSKKEDEILRKYFSKEGKKILLRLPNRTYGAVVAHAKVLGLKINKEAVEYKSGGKRVYAWTEEEDEIIRKYYPIEGSKVVERLPNRTEYAIRGRAEKLGVYANRKEVKRSSPTNGKHWSESEISILKDYFPIEGYKIVERLNNRTKKAIMHKVHELKLN